MDLSGKVLLVTDVVRRADDYYFACGMQMTQAQYDRVREARAQGVQLNTHAEIAAFLGMKPTRPNVVHTGMVNGIRPHKELTPEEHALAARTTMLGTPAEKQYIARGAAVPIPERLLARCFNCNTPVPSGGVRCTQCGALVAE